MPEPAPPRIALRRAGPGDLALLRRWDEAPQVVAADPDGDWTWEVELARDPDWREQLVAEVDGRPVGFVQIIDPAREKSRYWGEVAPDLRAIDLWIGEADALGRGYGSAIMRQAIERCFASPRVSAILVDPLADNVRAQRFYARFGFVPAGPRRLGGDDCLVYRLTREAWDARGRRPLR